MKPRKDVVNTRRGPATDNGTPTVIQTLECGHELTFIGKAAVKARTAEQRGCAQCPEIKPRPKTAIRRSAARAYLIDRDAEDLI